MPMFPTGAIKGRPPVSPLNVRTPAAPRPSTGGASTGNPWSVGGLGGNMPDDLAANPNAPGGQWSYPENFRPRTQTNAPGWGGGSVMGGLAQGQRPQSSQPIGQVNYGAVAGLQNYLSMLPASQQGAAAQQLRQQGLLGTYNGFAMGQAPMNNTLSQVSGGTSTGNFNVPSGNPAGYFAANGDYINGGVNTGSGAQVLPPGVHMQSYLMDNGGGGQRPMIQQNGRWVPYTGALSGQSYDSGGGIMGGQGQYGGASGGGFGGQTVGGASSGGGQGYPLQPQMQSAISGVLSNPSPYSQQQQSMLRNSATLGVEQQGRTAQQNAAEDAVRRGLNPAEAQANQFAIQGQMNAQRQGALNQFELNNAQATRQGLMGGLQAGMGFTGQQMQEEASIRSYLAQLAAAQSGNAQMFLNL